MKMYAYNNSSKSAIAFANALGIKRIKHEGNPLVVDGIINWGASSFKRNIQPFQGTLLNRPECVKKAVNKLQAFKALEGHCPLPPFTESRAEASWWLPGAVVCRTVLNGHSGAGIVIAETEEQLVDAPLYTKYIKKEHEYRLHVFNGKVFHVQKKARSKAVADENVNWKIRNHGNGFIYAHVGVDVEDATKQIAVNAVAALGLDFGAVDMMVTKAGVWYVLEVNTACGLENTTLEKYVEQFKQFV